MADFNVKTITKEEMTFRYLEGGNSAQDAPILLFVHGILGDARTFAPYLAAFPEHRVISLTLSGFGEHSAQDERLFDTKRHGEEINLFCRAILEAQKSAYDTKSNTKPKAKLKPKMTLFAWSYACHAALLAASETSSPIDELILYELIVPSYGMTPKETKAFTRDITKMMSPIIKSLRKEDLSAAVDAFIAACENAPLSLSEQPEAVQNVKRDNFHTLPKLLSQVVPEPISEVELQKIHAARPITILWGEKSRTIFTLSSFIASRAIGQNPAQTDDNDDNSTDDKSIDLEKETGSAHKLSGEIPGETHLLPENNPEKMIKIIHVYL